jgi:hypothetical protein
MKVAIVFIGTSKYLNFLPQYYQKIHENFLPNSKKTFLVFTDGEGDFPEDVKVYNQEHLNWPYITLTRFEIINKAREEIINHDWLVFLDADTLVIDKILENDFISNKPFFGVHHPCHYLKMPPHDTYPGAFEINSNSSACINESLDCSVYFQGCFWGGKVPKILEMIDDLQKKVNQDINNNVIAIWHDESHLNRYFAEHQSEVKIFGPEYAYPEVFSEYCNFNPKIIHLAKDNSKYQN